MSIGRRVVLGCCRWSTACGVVLIWAAPVVLIIFALLIPANAQYWGNSWGGRQQQSQQPYNPYGGYGGGYVSGPTSTTGTVTVAPYTAYPPSAATTAGMTAAQPVTVNATIIGKDDPKAQREIMELVGRAQLRGA